MRPNVMYYNETRIQTHQLQFAATYNADGVGLRRFVYANNTGPPGMLWPVMVCSITTAPKMTTDRPQEVHFETETGSIRMKNLIPKLFIFHDE